MRKQQKGYALIRRGTEKGFTLIELLVVIAIIGILATIVMVSLNTARSKARDVRRVSDIRQMQLALQMYYDANGSYPSVLTGLKPTYISAVPFDPNGTASYQYAICSSGTQGYHLGTGVVLENPGGPLLNDADANTTSCPGSFDGADNIYDVTP